MNPILSEKELEHDLQVLLDEFKASGNAWGQFPATSYGNYTEGWHNLRNLFNLAIKKLDSYRQKEFPKIYFSVEKLYHFRCSHCNGRWSIGKWRINPSQTCPYCAYLGEVLLEPTAEGKVS